MASNSGKVAGPSIVRTTTAEEEMADFDRLPPLLRRAISAAKLEWSSATFLGAMAQGHSPNALVEMLRNYERIF